MIYTLDSVKSESPYYAEVVLYFKTNPCPKLSSHKASKDKNHFNICDQPTCYFYHSPQERRRYVFDNKTSLPAYEPTYCSLMQDLGRCQYEDNCKYSHTLNEINYHPLLYKTEPCTHCQFVSTPNQCPRYHPDEGSRKLVLERFQVKKGRDTFSQRPSSDFPAQKNFNLDTFKTKQCTSKGNHNPKVCLFFHNEKDRRRSTKVFNYGWEPCPAKSNDCPKGDDCEYSHNLVEQLYHPDKYKKKFCSFHPHKIHDCDYGNYCSFAHGESEIKIELLHNMKKDKQFYMYKYKTILCPYNSAHARNQCLYAHNPQDFRRDPQLYKYNPTKCQYWTQEHITSYEKGNCPKSTSCENCHGWKELEYHPVVYKTKNCINGAKCTKHDCPNLHPEKEVVNAQADFGVIAPPNQAFLSTSSVMREKFYDNFKVKNSGKKERSFFDQKKTRLNEGTSEDLFLKERRVESKVQPVEGSTRANSFASSKNLQSENTLRRLTKKKKQMSLQNKKEDIHKTLAGKCDVIVGKGSKRGSSAQINNAGEAQTSSQEEKLHESFEESKMDYKTNKAGTPESFQFLENFTMEAYDQSKQGLDHVGDNDDITRIISIIDEDKVMQSPKYYQRVMVSRFGQNIEQGQ